jgi:hypothetical protein
MVITTWTITKLDVYEQAQGETNVVCVAYWDVTATDGIYSSSIVGTQSLIYVPGSLFTPYDDLTEPQIVEWVKNAMGITMVSNLENQVTNLVYDQERPVIVTPPLPWSN